MVVLWSCRTYCFFPPVCVSVSLTVKSGVRTSTVCVCVCACWAVKQLSETMTLTKMDEMPAPGAIDQTGYTPP